MGKLKVFLPLLFLLVGFVSAETYYYADVDIYVTNDGLVSVEGETNHPYLLIDNSPEFTSKEGRLWILNFSVEGIFSDVIYTLHLPKDTNINYIKTPKLSRVEHFSDEIRIIGTAENQKLNLVFQYQIKRSYESGSYLVLYILVTFIVGIVIFYFVFKSRKKEDFKHDVRSLTDRQKLIFDLIIKNKGSITQNVLEKETGLPKSSLSRNVDALVRKGILKKESKGMTNVLYLKDVPSSPG